MPICQVYDGQQRNRYEKHSNKYSHCYWMLWENFSYKVRDCKLLLMCGFSFILLAAEFNLITETSKPLFIGGNSLRFRFSLTIEKLVTWVLLLNIFTIYTSLTRQLTWVFTLTPIHSVFVYTRAGHSAHRDCVSVHAYVDAAHQSKSLRCASAARFPLKWIRM